MDLVADYVVQTHPGLQFLSTMPNFQVKYGVFCHSFLLKTTNVVTQKEETVTGRRFYAKRHNWTRRMTFTEFVDGDILDMIKRLESVEDMNSVRFCLFLWSIICTYKTKHRDKLNTLRQETHSLINTSMLFIVNFGN